MIFDSQNYLTLLGITAWRQRNDTSENNELPLFKGSKQIGKIYLTPGLSSNQKLYKLLDNILKAVGCHIAGSLQPSVGIASEQISIILYENNELDIKPDTDDKRQIRIPFSNELLQNTALKRDLWKVMKKIQNP